MFDEKAVRDALSEGMLFGGPSKITVDRITNAIRKAVEPGEKENAELRRDLDNLGANFDALREQVKLVSGQGGQLEKRVEQLQTEVNYCLEKMVPENAWDEEQPNQPEPRFKLGEVMRHSIYKHLLGWQGPIEKLRWQEESKSWVIKIEGLPGYFAEEYLEPADPPDSCEARCSDPIHKEKFQRTDIKHFCNTCGEEVEPRPKRYWRCGTHKTEYVRYVPPNCALCGKDMVLEEDTEAITASREILKDALLEPTDECEEDGLAREEDKPECDHPCHDGAKNYCMSMEYTDDSVTWREIVYCPDCGSALDGKGE